MTAWLNKMILSGWKRRQPPQLTIRPDYSEEWWDRTDHLREDLALVASIVDIVVVGIAAGILVICLIGGW